MPVAVVGAGRMGSFHIKSLAASSTVEVVAVADVRADAVPAGGVATYRSPESLLEDRRVRAWLIATPTPSHPALVQMALEAGLHVLCEKPLALDPAEGRRLGRLAEELGLVLQVGFWRRFSPPWAAARAAIERGTIGSPVMLRLSQWDADPPPPEFCDPAVSGGLAIDCGVDEFDLAEWLTGLSIERVEARDLPPVSTDVTAVGDVDNLLIELTLEGGTVAVVDLSRNARYGDDVRTEILGSNGAIFVDLLPTGRARLGTSEGVSVLPGSEVDDAMAAGVAGQAEAFAEVVMGKEAAVPDAVASNRAVAVGLAAQQAASDGAAVVMNQDQRR